MVNALIRMPGKRFSVSSIFCSSTHLKRPFDKLIKFAFLFRKRIVIAFLEDRKFSSGNQFGNFFPEPQRALCVMFPGVYIAWNMYLFQFFPDLVCRLLLEEKALREMVILTEPRPA